MHRYLMHTFRTRIRLVIKLSIADWIKCGW